MRTRARLLCGIGLAAFLVSPVARADQTDQRLPLLFDQLAGTESFESARRVEGMIWQIWLETENETANSHMAEGMDAMGAGDFASAVLAFTRAIDADPDFAEAWNKRATVLYFLGEYEGSLSDVDQTLALEPRHFGALSGMGLIHMSLSQEEQAINAFERALAVNPNMPGVVNNLESARQIVRDSTI